MKFERYDSIDNAYRTRTIRTYQQLGLTAGEFVCQEKVDGSNFSFWLDKEKEKFRCGKRSGWIGGMNSFYNHEEVEEACKDQIFALVDRINPQDYIAVYGEIFGGHYPHPDVEEDKFSTRVQNRVWYAPGNHFYAFDLVVDGKFVDIDTANEHFEAVGLLHAKTLFRGTFEECMEFNPNFVTTIPALLGLPPIPENFGEGTVIKPVKPKFVPVSNSRVILKNKAVKFAEREQQKERKPKKDKPQIEFSEQGQKVCDTMMEYVTENRLRSVLSKLGPVTNKDFGKMLRELVTDTIADYESDYESIKVLEKADRKKLSSELNLSCANLIRKNIVNIIDGVF